MSVVRGADAAGERGQGALHAAVRVAGDMPRLAPPTHQAALRVGWAVALTLKPGVAPLRSYIGQIEAIDERGLRLTLVDWFSGMFAGYDLYVPHSNIESALVCTGEHDLKGFDEYATGWQTRMNHPEAATKESPQVSDAKA